MIFLVPIALIGWIPLVICLFMMLPPRRAVIVSFLLAWLFLPMAGFSIAGLPDYTKMSATCVGVLLGAALFDADRLLAFRPRWVDLPIVIFCVVPFFSSITTGLGAYDGASTVLRQSVAWGLPYLIGRVYFSDLDGIRELAIGMFIGGLVYVPLCWIEIRMSPQLHMWVYGYHQHSFLQTMRFGGYRPMVFMQHGLMVSMWMALTALIGCALWWSRSLTSLWGIPMFVLLLLLAGTALLCKSSYAILLLFAGAAALMLTNLLRTRLFVIALLLFPPTFIALRASLVFDGMALVEMVNNTLGEERAHSIYTRVSNENELSQRALDRPVFGWGTWGDARVKDEEGKNSGIIDSLWIIVIGQQGLVGLVALITMLLLPMCLVLYDYPPASWAHPRVAPIAALGLLLVLYMFDHLMNAMVNPIFMLACGAVSSAHLWAAAQRKMAAAYAQAQMAARRNPRFGMPRPQPA